MRWTSRHICRKPRNVDLGTTSSNKNKHVRMNDAMLQIGYLNRLMM
uniref:Uncharacterized protein n=1 Tax=Triticum urartu TaxID=4572 RepID=A0A8R7P9X2_TRIUA